MSSTPPSTPTTTAPSADAGAPKAGARPLPRRFNLIRSFVLADFITLANATCGMASVLLCIHYLEAGHYDPYLAWAFALLPLAFVFDTADGAVARWRRRSSPYGADLDSLADIVSFGVAPAVVGFTLGLRGVWDTLILIYFVCCGISRLARFNVTAATLTDDATGKVRYFEGTPIPTSLFVVLVYFIAWKLGRTGEDELLGGTWTLGGGDLHPLGLLYLVSGSAMISERLRIPKL